MFFNTHSRSLWSHHLADQELYAVAVQERLGTRDDALDLSVLCECQLRIAPSIPLLRRLSLRPGVISILSVRTHQLSDTRVNHHMCFILGPLCPTC